MPHRIIETRASLPRNVVENARERIGIHDNMGELLRAALIIAANVTDDELVRMARIAAVARKGRPPRAKTSTAA